MSMKFNSKKKKSLYNPLQNVFLKCMFVMNYVSINNSKDYKCRKKTYCIFFGFREYRILIKTILNVNGENTEDKCREY